MGASPIGDANGSETLTYPLGEHLRRLCGASLALLECARAKEVRLHVISGGRDGDEHVAMEAFFWL